jgi:3D (Asp-Asp-Asp) domain-containing protein
MTASGRTVRYNGGVFAAADTDVLPFNTRIVVPGYNNGRPIPVIDRGGDIVGRRVDVFFRNHADAEAWGRKVLQVTVLK